ncbi:FAD-binding oxidoreductase [candidate division KSB1 bacterium]
MARHKYVVQENNTTPGDVVVIKLVPQKGGPVFDFKPGQYAMLSFQSKTGKLFTSHPFSIASSPTQRDHLQFGIKIEGNFTQNIAKLEPGDTVSVSGPYGSFVFDENKYQNVVHVAGGIGITPFISAARYATDKGLSNKLTMLYSSQTLASATFLNDIKKLQETNPNFKAIFSITKEDVPDHSTFLEKGYIDKEMILKHASPVGDKTFLLCGPPKFMEAMEGHLQSLGVPKNRVLKEEFSMTPKLPFRENFLNIFSVYGATAVLLIFFLNFVYQAETIKTGSGTVNTKGNEIIASLINEIVADRKSNILDLKSRTSNKTNQANLNKQLETQKTIFKQETLKQQNPPAPQPAPYVAPVQVKPTAPQPAPEPYVAPVEVKPRTTVS